MTQTTYRRFEDALDNVVQQLASRVSLDPLLLGQLVERADVIGRVTSSASGDVTRGVYEAHSKVVRYVIRDDLLFSLENFLDLLKQAVGFSVGLLSSLNPAGVPAGIKGIVDALHGLAAAYRRIVSLGYRPTPEEFAIFAALKELNSGTPSEIANALKGIDSAVVEQTLTRYEETPDQKSGFTKRDDAGRWQLVGF